jgi:hypothetical protein
VADRREAKRYRVKEGIFAVLAAVKDKLGPIKDISIKGLSFRYVNDDILVSGVSELKIIIAGMGLYLEGIQVEPVSDFEVKNGFSVSPLKLRQVNVRFINLTSKQTAAIERFILVHTTRQIALP